MSRRGKYWKNKKKPDSTDCIGKYLSAHQLGNVTPSENVRSWPRSCLFCLAVWRTIFQCHPLIACFFSYITKCILENVQFVSTLLMDNFWKLSFISNLFSFLSGRRCNSQTIPRVGFAHVNLSQTVPRIWIGYDCVCQKHTLGPVWLQFTCQTIHRTLRSRPEVGY